MEKLLKEAEKIIQMNTPPKVCRLYNNKKREILFGPFSDIIITLQSDNKKLSEQFKLKSSEVQPKNLQSSIKKSLISILTEQLHTKIDDPNKNLNELYDLLLEKVQNQEKDKRKDIQRYRNNIIKFDKKIEESKNVSIQKSPPPIDNRTQLIQTLKKNQTNLNMMKKNLNNMISENNQFSSKIKKIQAFIQKKSKESEDKKENYKRIKNKIQDLAEYKQKLSTELIEVNESVQKTILLQRFGPGILSEGKMPKIEQIMNLKKEIIQLKEEKEKLENKKREKIINSIKQSQKNLNRHSSPIIQ
ncbi:hypothetical protein M9Y10_006199 [Tritrichomonas musculus]|uniref:Uncharacterized protein n=1 Tax=Tritrichomonas musculus TaxID=1915356 RepID=A0ABR2JDJ1_9EUKA